MDRTASILATVFDKMEMRTEMNRSAFLITIPRIVILTS